MRYSFKAKIIDYEQSLFFLQSVEQKRETRKWPRARLMVRDGRGTKKPCRPRFARLAASRACTLLTKLEEKERLLAVY